MRFRTICFICSLALAITACGQKKEEKPQLPPPEISVYVTQGIDIPIYQEFVGQISGSKDISIRARVEGFLEGIHFQEGSKVKKGDLLYTIDSQPFEADVAAKMSKVAEAKTLMVRADNELRRIRPLAKSKAVSQSDLDSAVAEYEASKASLEAAEANLRASKIQLGYTKIYSPIDGIIGKTQAKEGDFVGRSPNPVILNVVSNVETVLVDFFLTENQYLTLARRFQNDQDFQEATQKGHGQYTLELILSDGSLYPEKGKADFIDRQVDPMTGAILVQASFPNPDGLIRPGQFGKIKAQIELVKNGILVPQRCVSEIQGIHRVYVVNDENKIEERQVKVGTTIQNFWLIREGLKPGEKVVYEGLQVVMPGAVVKPVIKEINLKNTEKQ